MKPLHFRSRAFTLIEIMIVVSVVVVLSLLAMVAIGRIKDRVARNLLENNLRQLYQAKEFYFTQTGDPHAVLVMDLFKQEYLRKSLFNSLYVHGSLETKMGWIYQGRLESGAPVWARHYGNSRGTGPVLETIWYPAPPEGTVTNTGSSSQPVTPPPLVPQPPVNVQQPPVTAQPPAVVAQPPVVVAQPPITITTVNPPGNQGSSGAGSTGGTSNNPGNQPQPNQSPGNSAHGHGQGHGQGQGSGPHKP